MNYLSENELVQIVNRTRLNSNLIMHYYSQFLHRFPCGYINRNEFNDLVGKLIIDESDESAEDKLLKIQLSQRMFDLCDYDENGKINFKEYFVHFYTRTKGDTKQKLELIFDMFDMNRNQSIDFNELHTIVKILLRLKRIENADALNEMMEFKSEIYSDLVCVNYKLPFSYHVAWYVMRKFDLNRNAKISKSEFINGCLSNENIKSFLTPLKML